MKITYVFAVAAILLFSVAAAGCLEPPVNPNDPIIGTFEYIKDVPWLGNQGTTLYSLYYVFNIDGEGIQYWLATDGSDTRAFPITWAPGNGVYVIKIINPDGSIYGENLILDGNILRSASDTKNDGYFYKKAGIIPE